jgi:mRNA interferase YafQ
MYELRSTKAYRTSFKRVVGHKDFKLERYNSVIDQLLSGDALSPEFKDHELTGNFKGVHECHIQNDLLLLYEKYEDVLILLLVDIGTHSSLFRN